MSNKRMLPNPIHFYENGIFLKGQYERAMEDYLSEREYSPEDEQDRERAKYEHSSKYNDAQVDMQNQTNGKEKS